MTTPLPPASNLVGPTVTESEWKIAITAVRTFLSDILGTEGSTSSARSALGLSDAAITTVANIQAGAEDFEAGTVEVFFQSSAPTGWTQNTDHNDKVLRVVSGVGGGGSGDWVITGSSVNTHTLTLAEMPAHTHDTNIYTTSQGWNVPDGSNLRAGLKSAVSETNTVSNTMTSGDGGHVHGVTADGAWRPAFITMLIASKDA